MASSGGARGTVSRNGPAVNGAQVTDTSTQSVAHTFILAPRTLNTLTFPVPTVQPVTAAEVCALDVAPSAGAAATAEGVVAWVDACSTPILDNVNSPTQVCRIGVSAAEGTITTKAYNGAAQIPLSLGINYSGGGAQKPQIQCDFVTTGVVKVGFDGSDTVVGGQAALANAATSGFMIIPTVAGAPTGTPQRAAQGAPMVYDTTNNKLWVWNGAAWRGVVLA